MGSCGREEGEGALTREAPKTKGLILKELYIGLPGLQKFYLIPSRIVDLLFGKTALKQRGATGAQEQPGRVLVGSPASNRYQEITPLCFLFFPL